jgi:hypothetical protein
MAAKDFTLLEINLHEIFEYKDGHLFWKISKSGITKKQAGGFNSYGYAKVCFNKKIYFTHRIIFLMHHGFLPKVVDHIDGNKSNNLITNLRAADHSKNVLNAKKNILNTSGEKNVHWSKRSKKWFARVTINKKRKYVGYFDDLEDAKVAIIQARNKHYGEFANHG